MYLLSIINLLTFSAKLKLKFSLLIILITSKSIWKKVLNLQLALYTLFWHLNKRLWRNSLRKILTQVSSDQLHFHIVHRSYSLRRKMVHCASISTFMVLTASPKRITIHSRLFPICWTHLAKLRSTQRYIFTMLTIWFALPMVMNRKQPLGHAIDHLNGL